jgi:cysteine desulfurase
MGMRRQVYLDHSASTPVDPRVVEAMLPYFSDVYGNASSAHGWGRNAERAIEDAREQIARILNCHAGEIVFTSGGSESDNLALRGAVWQARRDRKQVHVITTPVEHSAAINTVRQMQQVIDIDYAMLSIDSTGMVNIDDFAAAIRPDSVLASVIYANNEVGTVQPIAQLAAKAREHGLLFHTDAVQAGGQLALDVQALGVDMLSLSAHKFYGPKGVGLLYVRKGVQLLPAQTGGSHEEGRRAGTSNTPLIIGMAQALQLAYDEYEQRTTHFRMMRDLLIEQVMQRIPQAVLTGHPTHRLPSHASFLFEGLDSSTLLMHLDMKGVAASGGSACKTGNPEPSEVLLAMGYTREQAMGTVRLTVGRQTTEADIEYAVEALGVAVEKLYKLNRVGIG